MDVRGNANNILFRLMVALVDIVVARGLNWFGVFVSQDSIDETR